MKLIRRRSFILCLIALGMSICAGAFGQAAAPAAAPAATPPPPSAASELKDAAARRPRPPICKKGDPGGYPHRNHQRRSRSDSKAGVTLADVANQVGQNKIAINFTWTLITGFLVMFMQAGIRHGGSGPVPGKERQPHLHDELLRVRVWPARILAHRICYPDGRRGGQRQSRRPQPSSVEHSDHVVREDVGYLWRQPECS